MINNRRIDISSVLHMFLMLDHKSRTNRKIMLLVGVDNYALGREKNLVTDKNTTAVDY